MKRMIVFGLMLVLAPALFAQMTMPMPADQKPAAMPDCAAMMKSKDAMKQHMAEMNAKLQTLVDDMNKAKGSAKTERIAAVINEMVAQRSMMQKEMAAMQPQMMAHMMEHMKSGMMKGMSDSMAGCPMMKEGSATTPPETEQKH